MRGQVFWVDFGFGRKPWVVLSNNVRNRNLDTVLAARITTTAKNAELPTVVELASDDPVAGYVVVDDIVQLYRDQDLAEPGGALGVQTMNKISQALRTALP